MQLNLSKTEAEILIEVLEFCENNGYTHDDENREVLVRWLKQILSDKLSVING